MPSDKIYEYGNFKFVVIRKSAGYAHNVVTIERVSGEWPEDNDLISIADNYNNETITTNKYHFGGRVSMINDDNAVVKVYTD